VTPKARPKGPLEPAELEARALSYLNRFDCSVQKLRTHLRQVIRRREGDREELEQKLEALLERYQASGLLNDERFAGRPVRVLQGRESQEGVARGVDTDGALLLETGGGRRRILSGEVSVRLAVPCPSA
jgi:SOS response regulatory protein OraA/RecX